MPLTRAWAIILAFLATACLAGMFLLSSNSGGGFTDADRAAVRAVTEAGVAALEAQLQASPVQQAGSFAQDSRIKEALAAKPDPDDPESLAVMFYDAVGELAEETRVRTGSNLTIAIVDGNGEVIAANGAAEKELPELVASTAFQSAPSNEDLLFSITLADKIYVVKLLRPDDQGRRLLAAEPLELGAGSLLRRVLGSSSPAGLVRKGELLGDIMGNQPVSEALVKLAKDHVSDTPNEGASKVFTVGEGMDTRLGALGRIPGPAGEGDNGAMLVVLSAHTAAAGQQDMAQALSDAQKDGTGDLPWPLLIGLLAVTVGLAFYLPGLEGLTPMRRLGREFNAIAQGTQHSIFHDRYGGTAGEVARAAAAAHEALRQAYLAELEIDEEDEVEEQRSSGPRSRPRTNRGRRTTRSTRSLGTGRNRSLASREEGSGGRPVAPEAPAPEPAPAPAPAAPPRPAVPTPPPRPPAPTPAPVASSAPVATGDEDREAYYRTVYDEFVRVKAECGEPTDKLSFEKFAQKLAKNTADIKKKKPGVADVNFTVYVKNGKAALKAKIVKE